jgi:hypothetical protein
MFFFVSKQVKNSWKQRNRSRKFVLECFVTLTEKRLEPLPHDMTGEVLENNFFWRVV